jgi:lipopolysaccharide transport system ATP-binding protein
MNKNIVISVNNISFYMNNGRLFNDQKINILKDISFDIYKGETLGVLGANGSGKSTLLRLLSNIYFPDKGEIINFGFKSSLLSLQVGFMDELTGRENIKLSCLLQGLKISEINSIMDKIIEFSELKDSIDEQLKTYSSGMRSRLGFSVAYVAYSDIILIDETLSVGDESFRIKSAGAIKSLINSSRTVVLVSHNLQVLSDLSDRIIWLESGRVKAIGDPESIIERYKTNINNPKKS